VVTRYQDSTGSSCCIKLGITSLAEEVLASRELFSYMGLVKSFEDLSALVIHAVVFWVIKTCSLEG
jgi:hypothetical protein